ncbi:hypothetical protein ACOI9X_12745 [Pseudomonas sp. P2757]|uniref:hypothetical protein n=1 Tax=unclassified Pseudomonas TaxID=196821 RepID=UPI003B5A5D69
MSVLSRPNLLWLYYPICWLSVTVLVLHLAFYDWLLLTPTDVGGTLMGGMGGQMYASAWMITALGLLIAMLVRLPGSTVACMAAGAVQTGISIGWLVMYPDNAEQVIYSTSQKGIVVAMLIGVAMFLAGFYLRAWLKKRSTQKPLSRLKLVGKFAVAALLALIFIGVPVKIAQHRSLPHCAFDKNGMQLTICLGDSDDERVFVD